jgi:hypothetical protein
VIGIDEALSSNPRYTVNSRPEPIYGQEGACEVGRNSWLYQRWSEGLAGMYIYRDELVLSMSFRRYSLPREKVLLIHRYRDLLQIGLKIKHTVEDYPPYMVFYPVDIVEMEEALDTNGFPLAQPV